MQFMDYEPRGAARELFRRRDPQLMINGPAGTGKSRGCLEKVNWCAEKYPKARLLMLRKSRKSLTQSAMVTFEKEVQPHPGYIPFHHSDQEYRYPNGSILAVAGVDDPQKLLSSQWDLVYVPQAEELLAEDWQSITTRMRNGRMPYQQVMGDCNPGPPQHWIKQASAEGLIPMLESQHEDNPVLWDRYNAANPDHGAVPWEGMGWTPRGRAYVHGVLDKLTGVTYKRLRKGEWAAAEGTVYEEEWSRTLHLIDRRPIPKTWPRFWVVDFGYTNPFVWQSWAEDPDGRLYREHEIYRTRRLVEDHAKTILEVTKDDPKPRAIICDHDAEDRATLEKHLKLETKPAWKAVSTGIGAVKSRLEKAGDGKPRIYLLRDSLVEVDKTLTAAHKPSCTEDEMESYVWDTSNHRKKGEEPVKENDHGCDAMRYVITFVDKTWQTRPQTLFAPVSVSRETSDSEEQDFERVSPWRNF